MKGFKCLFQWSTVHEILFPCPYFFKYWFFYEFHTFIYYQVSRHNKLRWNNYDSVNSHYKVKPPHMKNIISRVSDMFWPSEDSFSSIRSFYNSQYEGDWLDLCTNVASPRKVKADLANCVDLLIIYQIYS